MTNKLKRKKTYRPREFKWQSDSISTGVVVISRNIVEIDRILAQNGCREIAISAGSRQVDTGLVMLEADSKLRATRFTAPTDDSAIIGRCFESVAAMTFCIEAQLILKTIKT